MKTMTIRRSGAVAAVPAPGRRALALLALGACSALQPGQRRRRQPFIRWTRQRPAPVR